MTKVKIKRACSTCPHTDKNITYNKDCFSSVKREKEVECNVELSYHDQDIQKIGDII